MSLKEVDELGSKLIHDENKKAGLERNIVEFEKDIKQKEDLLSVDEDKKQAILSEEKILIGKVENLIEKIDLSSVSLGHFIHDEAHKAEFQISRFMSRILEYQNAKKALFYEIGTITSELSKLQIKIDLINDKRNQNLNSKYSEDTQNSYQSYRLELSRLSSSIEDLNTEVNALDILLDYKNDLISDCEKALLVLEVQNEQVVKMLDESESKLTTNEEAWRSSLEYLGLKGEYVNMEVEDHSARFIAARESHDFVQNLVGNTVNELNFIKEEIREAQDELGRLDKEIEDLAQHKLDQVKDMKNFDKFLEDKMTVKIELQKHVATETNRLASVKQSQEDLDCRISTYDAQKAEEIELLDTLQSKITIANNWMTRDPEICGPRTIDILKRQEEAAVRKDVLSSRIQDTLSDIEDVQSKIASASEENLAVEKNIQTTSITERMKLNTLEALKSERRTLAAESTSLNAIVTSNLGVLEGTILLLREDCNTLADRVIEAKNKRSSLKQAIESIKGSLKMLNEKERDRKIQTAIERRVREKEQAMVTEHQIQLKGMSDELTKADTEFKLHLLKVEKILEETEKRVIEEVRKASDTLTRYADRTLSEATITRQYSSNSNSSNSTSARSDKGFDDLLNDVATSLSTKESEKDRSNISYNSGPSQNSTPLSQKIQPGFWTDLSTTSSRPRAAASGRNDENVVNSSTLSSSSSSPLNLFADMTSIKAKQPATSFGLNTHSNTYSNSNSNSDNKSSVTSNQAPAYQLQAQAPTQTNQGAGGARMRRK